MTANSENNNTKKAVDEDEILYHGIISKAVPCQIVPNGKDYFRPTSAAFQGQPPHQNKLSVDIASKTNPEESLKRLPKKLEE